MEMLYSDGGNDEHELNEAIKKAGVNLPALEENWKAQGIENVLEEELKKISELFIVRQRAELARQNRKLGIATGTGNHSKIISLNPAGFKPRKKRGRRTNGEVLHDLGILMLN